MIFRGQALYSPRTFDHVLITRSDRFDSPAARNAMSRTSSSFSAATSFGGTAPRSASACSKKYMRETPKNAGRRRS